MIPKKIQDMGISCISPKDYPCGKCFKCVEREKMLMENHYYDNLIFIY